MKKLILSGALLCAFILSAMGGSDVRVAAPAVGLPDGSTAVKVYPVNADGTANIGGSGALTVVGSPVNVSATFTRPADTTAYAVNDLVANSTTAGSVVPMTFTNIARDTDRPIKITRVRFQKNSTNVTSASFVVLFYNVLPVPANGDNGAYSTSVNGFVGSSTISAANFLTLFSDGVLFGGTIPTSINMIIKPASGTRDIYALIAATATYTPASAEVFTITIEAEQY